MIQEIRGTWSTRVVTLDGKPLDPARSQQLWNHSPDGFMWGYGGSGPAQLALAILLALGLDNQRAVELHQRFKFDVIAQLAQEEDFVLSGHDLRQWIEAQTE